MRNVIISRGKYNSYNHPHPEVLKSLDELALKVYDTAIHGAIEVTLAKEAAVKPRRLASSVSLPNMQ